ncbi:unnamed protein product [Schistosoma margrebowiei]|uniref:Uncharacterized protein n=1 Tax=Schistosoma margrebowiei TaxID=48269 RepID=A0A183MH68_9TREM|nr:unnamed protein product [Schistosoma margrebowiei]
MVVGGSRQETLDTVFVLLDTHQQGVPVILRELVLAGGFDLVSLSFTVKDVTTVLSSPLVGGSQQETLDPVFVLLGTRQQCVPVILRELMIPDGLDPMSPSFTVTDVTTELSKP